MKRALVVIDVQMEYFDGSLPIEYPPTAITLRNIGRAMDAARDAGVPVVVVQHSAPAGSPLFAKTSPTWQLHPVVAERARDHYIEKSWPSVFTGTDFADWLQRHAIDTLTIVGYMTQNCDASTIFEAMHRALQVEFLADASGAPSYANDAGHASAQEIHRVFSVVFHSNFAAVASTETWLAAVASGEPMPRDNVAASNRRARQAAQPEVRL